MKNAKRFPVYYLNRSLFIYLFIVGIESYIIALIYDYS